MHPHVSQGGWQHSQLDTASEDKDIHLQILQVDLENTSDRLVEERFFLVVSIDWIRNLQLVSQSTKVITCPLDT